MTIKPGKSYRPYKPYKPYMTYKPYKPYKPYMTYKPHMTYRPYKLPLLIVMLLVSACGLTDEPSPRTLGEGDLYRSFQSSCPTVP